MGLRPYRFWTEFWTASASESFQLEFPLAWYYLYDRESTGHSED